MSASKESTTKEAGAPAATESAARAGSAGSAASTASSDAASTAPSASEGSAASSAAPVSTINITVASPLKTAPYKMTISVLEPLTSIKQYLVSLGQIQQPITCFALFRGDEKLDTFATIEELGLRDGDALKIVPQDYTLAELNSHILQTRELLGFVPQSLPYSAVNAGAVRVNQFKVKKQAKKTGEKALTDAPDLPDMDILHYERGQIEPASLVASENETSPSPAARTLHFSCWQPPSFSQKLKGHLAYLKFVAQDSKTFHITATTKGFYVNNSTDEKFDDSIKTESASHISLLHLIGIVSPRTLNSVERMNNTLAKISPQTWTLPRAAYLAAPWLVETKEARPRPDIASSQTLFSDTETVLKDWNEDYQTTRELPRLDENGNPTVRDRIIREKLLVNTCHDFASAATKGALDILSGNIQPFNPNEDPESQIFLRNGIFYTFGFDSVGIFSELGGDDAARVAAIKDLRGVEQLMTLDLEGVSPVLTAVIDYCGRRIIAQGPVPGIFRDNVEPQILYGSGEGRSQVFSDASVEPEMTKIAEAFHLKRHTAADIEGNTAELATSVDMKCMTGSDGRRYVLDCGRVSPVDVGFLQDHKSYPHQMALLRPEAVGEWVRAKVREDLESQGKDAKLDEEKIQEYQRRFVLNPDVGLKSESEPAGYAEDRATIVSVSNYIKETIVPRYVSEIAKSATVYPIDGTQLTDGMHRRGISMRYLGLLHAEAVKHELEYLVDVISREAISRAIKHLVNAATRPLDFTAVQGAIIGFLSSIEQQTSAIEDQVKRRFSFAVDASRYLDRQLLREISIKLGLQLDSRILSTPQVAWSKLEPKNLVSFVPRVRYATIQSAIPEEALNAGRLSVANNDKKEEGLDIVRESLSLHEQVYGAVHPETGRAFNQASLVYHEVQDYNTAAELCRKAITINERVQGVDSAETIVMYINLAFYERARGNQETALELLQHVLNLWTGIGSTNHPDLLNTYQSVATLLFQARFYKEAITWFDWAIELAEKYDRNAAAPLYLQVSQAHVIYNNAYATATRCAEKAFSLYKSTAGPEDNNTKECKKWLDQLVNATVRDLKAQKMPPMPKITLKQKKEPKKSKKKDVDAIVDYIMGDNGEKKKKKGKKGKKSQA